MTKVWPDYLPDPDKETKLRPAILYNGNIHTKDEYFVIQSWKDLRKVVIVEQLCLFVESLTNNRSFPYMREVKNTKGCKVHETTEWVKVSIRYAGRTYWIASCSQWGWKSCDFTFLQFIGRVYDHCGGVVKPTPAGVGKRLLLESWRQHNELSRQYAILDPDWPASYIPEEYAIPKRFHPLPPRSARMLIKDQLHGGRIEIMEDKLPGYFKLDQDNALVSHFGTQPTGIAHRFIEENPLWTVDTKNSSREESPSQSWIRSAECFRTTTNRLGATFFCRARVQIYRNLPLGPFPLRTPTLHWPDTTGIYDCYLWKEQLQDCVDAGCSVQIVEGWYWKYFTTDLLAWTKYLIYLRKTAPTEEVRKAVKRIASATISCMGIGDARYSHTRNQDNNNVQGVGWRGNLFDERGRTNINVLSTRDSNRPTPVHWYAYTWMQVARTLYRMALPHAQANELVALHTDALWVKSRPQQPTGWKLEELLGIQ